MKHIILIGVVVIASLLVVGCGRKAANIEQTSQLAPQTTEQSLPTDGKQQLMETEESDTMVSSESTFSTVVTAETSDEELSQLLSQLDTEFTAAIPKEDGLADVNL